MLFSWLFELALLMCAKPVTQRYPNRFIRRLIVIKAKHLVILFLSLLVFVACDIIDPPSPTGPSSLVALPADGRITLEWEAPSAFEVAGYRVYRSTSSAVASSPANLLTPTPLPRETTTFSDDEVENGTTYYYLVTAVSPTGAESRASNLASAAPQAGMVGRPSVLGVRPVDGATNVGLRVGIGADPNLPNSGVDIETMSPDTVRLIRVRDGAQIPADPGTSGGFDTITLQPKGPLEPNTQYRFEVTSGLRDQSGQAFVPFSSTFTTGAGNGGPTGPVSFEQVALPSTVGTHYTQLAVGPDGRLYAATLFGQIHRFDISGDGTLGDPQMINTIPAAEGAPRLMIGLTFDPAATANNLVLWTSHTEFPGFDSRGRPLTGADWTGKITRLSGANLQSAQDFVVGLPRSTKDHVTNSVAFGPDGALYVSQGANTAMGAPDNTWGWRPERLLSAAILRIDVSLIAPGSPLNVKTEDGGSYDPFAAGAPLTIFASGVRNAYDLVWHSNGQLYVPTNGSGPGGNIPRSPASVSELPEACTQRIDGRLYTGPFITDDKVTTTFVSIDGNSQNTIGGYPIPTTQNDFLFRVEDGGYYGHPNPTRCEYVFFGGNVGTGPDQIKEYVQGVQPDPNYRGFAFDFGKNPSTNGIIEYKSDVFDGALQGKLLVVRFALGNDIVVMTPAANGNIVETQTGLPGMSGFLDPLAIAENPANGHLYVSEFNRQLSGLSLEEAGEWLLEAAQAGASPRITLLRPGN